jgi:glycosyltransferase involved in cell wall biosynthesis
MQALSVVIITYNEEQHIGRCIESVKGIADEVIVLDSFSTDATIEIATRMGARTAQEKFRGYTDQKNLALQLSSYDYVLSLDADEALDETLRNAILQEKQNFQYPAYTMNRCTNYCGKFIRHGHWYPDKKLRLFNKRSARWSGMDLHEKVELAEGSGTGHLNGDILHYSYDSIHDHLTQGNKFTTIAAFEMQKKGKKGSFFKILVNPFWSFFSAYILRLGFLDGFYGFVIAMISAHLNFLKYVKLRRLNRDAGLVSGQSKV